MPNYLIDYYTLNKEGERDSEFYETIELEAENYEDAEVKLYRCRGEVEITSMFTEEN